jgi:peptidoglycan/LPS O-acetylase OafA/YrhL
MLTAVAPPTLADRLTVTHSRPAGFDWMRLLLATAIVGWHTIGTSYGDVAQHGFWSSPLWRPPLAAILGMFFALSGFLVAGSLERCRTMVSFVGLRVMRILPALAVEVLLCALILGPLLTHCSLHEYFADRRFWNYLANMLGIVHFVLPGVFLDNPWPGTVNAQLWSCVAMRPYSFSLSPVSTGARPISSERSSSRAYCFSSSWTLASGES